MEVNNSNNAYINKFIKGEANLLSLLTLLSLLLFWIVGILDDNEIGELNIKWNWLVGEYDAPPSDVKNVHLTVGGPYFSEYSNTEFASEWFNEKALMEYCLQREPNKASA